MADETIEQETVEEEVQPEKKGGGFFKVFLILLVVICLGGGAGYYFYGQQLMAKYLGKGVEAKPGEKKEEKREVGPTVTLEPFVFNVSGNLGRIAKVCIAVEVKDKKLEEKIKEMTPALRDGMLTILSSKTPEILMDVNGRNQIKKELFDGAKKLFKPGECNAVYITDIIMQ